MITLGDKRELFLDDMLIETGDGIELRQTTPERKEIVLTLNKPWEGRFSAYHTVIQHPETRQIYLYYRATDLRGVGAVGHEHNCLAISDDGVHFERINNGFNNIFLKHMSACHNFAPFYDTNPDCPEDERFKAVAYTQHEYGKEETTLSGYYSKDGIEWHLYEGGPIMRGSEFDSLNTAFWDSNIKKYRCYSRYFKRTAEEELVQKALKNYEPSVGLRAIQCSVSDDFIHWSDYTPNTYNGGQEPIYHFYTNSTCLVPGAEQHYVAFPMRFNEARHKVLEYNIPGVADCMMLSSRDGYDWVMRNQPWIYPNMDKENWTQRNFMVSAGFADDYKYFNFYVLEHYGWDDIRIVRYCVPKMRLGYAYGENGSFITKQFVLNGERLTFNYNTSAIGTLFVDVLDENKNIIQGYSYEIYGNESEYAIDLKELKGRKLHLSIKLQDAYIYSIGY